MYISRNWQSIPHLPLSQRRERVAKMEKHIIISKKELCGRSQKTTRMLENVVKHNALNKTGHINYNKGGVKDGVGFQSCSDKFVDNFVLRVLVADSIF